jgi:kynureninase
MAGYADVLFEKAREAGAESLTLFDPAVADLLDAQDPLAEFRAEYLFPKGKDGKDAIYLCGNSLGLQPRDMKRQVVAQLDKWGAEGVEGHFAGERA